LAQRSAGLVVFRKAGVTPEFFLVHPGGPFWAKKDDGSWSIPKGLYEEGEDALTAAKREFTEETGQSVDGEFTGLGDYRQPSGKIISAWAVEGDCDAAAIKSNLFSMEWPPKSGKTAEFPEVDRAGWWTPRDALIKITKGQRPILERLMRYLNIAIDVTPPGPADANQPSEPAKGKGTGQGSLFD
jgi:predicted NUDIX family NTP pyrophosphohydrolase